MSAAEQAAEETRTMAQEEAETRLARAEETAKKLRDESQRESTKTLDSARTEATKLVEDARKQAAERVSEAERTADETLADARAVSAGLRQLGMTLGEQAETILREVQAGHRKLRSDLRAAAGRGRAGDDAPADSKGGGLFEDLDVPAWAGPKDARRR